MPDLAEYWKARAESAEVEKVTAIQDFARHTAERIRAELVCCDVYERNHGTDRGSDGHGICFWGEASARLVERQAGLRDDCTCPNCGGEAVSDA